MTYLLDLVSTHDLTWSGTKQNLQFLHGFSEMGMCVLVICGKKKKMRNPGKHKKTKHPATGRRGGGGRRNKDRGLKTEDSRQRTQVGTKRANPKVGHKGA
jgi:hypothetical protein